MFRYPILALCILLISIKTAYTQNFPYPLQPQNLASTSTDSIIFKWKGAPQFAHYTLEIYDCNYSPGDNFNSIQLQNYAIAYTQNAGVGNETSGLTHNETQPGNFSSVEDGGSVLLSHVSEFSINSTYPISNFPGSDFEGITYLYNNYYSIIEERFGYLHLLKFNYNNGNLSSVTLENTLTLSHPLITGNNEGFESLTYNPITNKIYTSKEFNPVKIFEFELPAAPNFNGAVTINEPFDIAQVSWAPQDASGMYHFGLDKEMSVTRTGEHLLILSKNSEAIYETDLSGNLISQLNFEFSGLLGSLVGNEFKAEGITYHDGIIWVSEDNNGYYFGFENIFHENPYAQTNNVILTKSNISETAFTIPSCILNGQTEYCWRVIGHTTNGSTVESEYFSFTTGNFQTDYSAGASCDDGDPCTTNDVQDGNCNCVGTFTGNDSDNDGICDPIDNCPNFNNNLIGTPCNDGNANTLNDVYTNACICAGTLPINNICISIDNSNDDVEENGVNGSMYFDSSDLELVYDGNNRGNQMIGLRFNNIPAEQGANIISAYIQFAVDETNSISTNLIIKGENTDHSNSFTNTSYNLTSRQKTVSQISWSPPSWNQVGQSDGTQQTPDISDIIDEIVSRPGYSSGNSITLFVTGNGERTAESYDGVPARAPRLCMAYSNMVACPAIGNACDDGSACTSNDVIIDNNCTCLGTSNITCNTDICLADVEVIDPNNACNCVIALPQVLGCTDDNACNYNPQANCDDGSCQNQPSCNNDICLGDVEAINPNNACSCVIVETQKSGCTDVNACNYLPTANCNDGSCTYLPSSNVIHQNPAAIPGGVYQAKQSIQSNITFADFDEINYFAEDLIQLNNHFSIPLGKDFSAIIQPAFCE